MKTLRAQAKPPSHPGALLREIILPELAMTQMELAKCLGISRYAISGVIQERRSISPDMALRLGRFCGNGARLWLNMQIAADLWKLANSKRLEYEKILTCAASIQW
jgi:addiction module HigA family antidote